MTITAETLVGWYGPESLSQQAYWLNPSSDNDPTMYLRDHEDSSQYLVDKITQTHLAKTASILELGCNSGTNLAWLKDAGYTNLEGVELNPHAVDVLRTTYPQLDTTPIHTHPIEQHPFTHHDLIFTMAVLEHLPPESEPCFTRIANNTRYLLTIEDEHSQTGKHFPRNYNHMFTALGMRELWAEPHPADLGEHFTARLFLHKP